MADTMNHRPLQLLAALVVCAVAVLVADPAAAQPQKPLAMTFVDASPNQSAAIHDKLRSVVERSNDINFTNPSDFLFNARQFDITLDTLASSTERKKKKELIRRAMRANNLETIVIYKRTGDQLHLILLGPSGAQLEHYRSPIRQPQINDEQAIAVLRKIFKVVVPKVKQFRQRNPDANQTAPQPQQGQGGPQQGSGKSKKDTSGNDAGSGGRLASGWTIEVAPIFGRRSLSLSNSDRPDLLNHASPILGGGGRLSTIFGALDSKTSALGATVYGEFAPFKTNFTTIEGVRQGTYFRGGARLRYYSALSSTVTMFGQVGGESLNIGLKDNSVYVGSTYFALTAGMGANIRVGDTVEVTLEADGMPTLLTNTNSGAFGDGGFSFGFSGGPTFSLRTFDPWILSASYEFVMYSPDHPNPQQAEYGDSASGTDILHIGGASVGYTF